MNDVAHAFRASLGQEALSAVEEPKDQSLSLLQPATAALAGKVHGFVPQREEVIEEYRARAQLFRHEHSGAQVMIVQNENPNITFALSLLTLPDSDESLALDAAARLLAWRGANDGKPHCAEHWVLRGSQRFPSSEPTLQYGKASVASDANAFTASCSTTFYVTTNNVSDLRNHIALILDAVFHPLLEDDTFGQDIWRIEKVGLQGRLRTNGAALNEQRTGYADPIETHGRMVYRHILPDTPLAYDTGGDPLEMITLTPEKVRAFIRDKYHPSNSCYLIIGKVDPEEILPLLDAELAACEAKEFPAPIIEQAPFSEPKRVTEHYPGGKTEDAGRDSILSVNFCLGKPANVRQEIEYLVLEEILLSFDNSPLAHALNEADLGEAVLDDALLDDGPYSIMSLGMSGCGVAAADQIEALILDTLKRLTEEGISKRLVLKAVDSVEFSMREISNDASPGTSMMDQVLEPWQLGREPIESLRYTNEFKSLRQDLEAGEPVFETLIAEKLTANPHRLILILRPQRKLLEQREERENRRITELVAQGQRIWSEEDNQAQVKAGDKGILSLPRMKVTELNPKARVEPLSEKHSSDRIFAYERPTNGVVSMELALSLAALQQELLPYLCLWLDASRELRPSKGQDGFGGEYCAEVAAWPRFDSGALDARVLVNSKGLATRGPDMLAVMEDVFGDVNLDRKSLFIRVALRHMADLENELAEESLEFAENHACAKVDLSSWVDEQCAGIAYIQFLRQFVRDARKSWPAVHEKIELARTQLLSSAAPRLRITGQESVISANINRAQEALAKFTVADESLPAWQLPSANLRDGIIVPAHVNSVIQALPLGVAGFAHHGCVYPIVNHLRVVYLWQLLRRWGGAYDPHISYAPASGILSLGSGQGLNISEPLDAFRGISTWLRSGVLQDEELRRSKIGAVGALDISESVHDLCHFDFVSRLRGVPHDFNQRERSQLLDTGVSYIDEFVVKFEEAIANRPAPVTVIGAEKALNEVKSQKGEEWIQLSVLE